MAGCFNDSAIDRFLERQVDEYNGGSCEDVLESILDDIEEDEDVLFTDRGQYEYY